MTSRWIRKCVLFLLIFILIDCILFYCLTRHNPQRFHFIFSLQIFRNNPWITTPNSEARIVSKHTWSGIYQHKSKSGLRQSHHVIEVNITSGKSAQVMGQNNMGHGIEVQYPPIRTQSLVKLRWSADITQSSSVSMSSSTTVLPNYTTTDDHTYQAAIPGSGAASVSPTDSQRIVHNKRYKFRFKRENITQLVKMAEDSFLSTAFGPIMTAEDKEIMSDLLRVFIKAVDQANLTYFMYGGTLLGSYRHHDIIPWDDDIDFMMKSSERQKIKATLRKLRPTYILYSSSDLFRWKFFSQHSSTIKGVRWRYPFLDLCFYKENSFSIWDEDPFYASTFKYDKSLIFPLTNRPFWNMTLKAPKDTMTSLAKNYNLDYCQTNRYIHKIENWSYHRAVKIPCEKLWHMFPFVFRHDISSPQLINETLQINGKTINWFISSS